MQHVGLRVTDLEQSLTLYTGLGYAELGGVPETEFGSLSRGHDSLVEST